jgi:hypothetical protein
MKPLVIAKREQGLTSFREVMIEIDYFSYPEAFHTKVTHTVAVVTPTSSCDFEDRNVLQTKWRRRIDGTENKF